MKINEFVKKWNQGIEKRKQRVHYLFSLIEAVENYKDFMLKNYDTCDEEIKELDDIISQYSHSLKHDLEILLFSEEL